MSNNLPEGTDFHWGVNYKAKNQTETLAQIRLLNDAFKSFNGRVHLKNLEIGNEVDLARTSVESPIGYVDYWTKAVNNAISSGAITLGKQSGTYLSPGGFARSIRFGTNWVWTAISVFSAGLIDDKNLADKTDQFTGHLYSASYNAAFGVTSGVLMDKVNVRGNLSTRVEDAVITRKEGLKYVLVSIRLVFSTRVRLIHLRANPTLTPSKFSLISTSQSLMYKPRCTRSQ